MIQDRTQGSRLQDLLSAVSLWSLELPKHFKKFPDQFFEQIFRKVSCHQRQDCRGLFRRWTFELRVRVGDFGKFAVDRNPIIIEGRCLQDDARRAA